MTLARLPPSVGDGFSGIVVGDGFFGFFTLQRNNTSTCFELRIGHSAFLCRVGFIGIVHRALLVARLLILVIVIISQTTLLLTATFFIIVVATATAVLAAFAFTLALLGFLLLESFLTLNFFRIRTARRGQIKRHLRKLLGDVHLGDGGKRGTTIVFRRSDSALGSRSNLGFILLN